jgi:hypothetical protein
VLYITSRRYLNRPSNVVDVKVYTNLDVAQLSVNGVVVGTQASVDHIFRWTGVRLAAGANAIQVTATQNGITYTDSVTWYPPRNLGGVPFARINFQPWWVPVADGYQPDYGYVFGDRGNGFAYGWDVDNSAYTWMRGVRSDVRFDTGIYMQLPGSGRVWEIAVPNGAYDVHLAGGDPSLFDGIYQIAVEGVLTISGGVNILNRSLEAWRTVTVSDGRLTITNADGSSNNKLNFIEINQISRDGGGGNAAVPPSSLGDTVPFLLRTRNGRDDAGSVSGLGSNPSFVDLTFRTLPLVVTGSSIGSPANQPSRTRRENPAFVTWSRRSELPIAIPEAVVDASRPVLDDKARL